MQKLCTPGGNGVIYIQCVGKEKEDCQPTILHPAKLSFGNKGEINSFRENQKLREFITSRPALQEILKKVLHLEVKTIITITKTWKSIQEIHLTCRDTHRLKTRRYKKIFYTDGNQKQVGVATLLSDKADFRSKTVKRDKKIII